MKSNLNSNTGNILGGRINNKITGAMDNARTSQDLSIINMRAGWQQRFGALQMVSVVPNSYALFGGWSGSSTTVAP